MPRLLQGLTVLPLAVIALAVSAVPAQAGLPIGLRAPDFSGYFVPGAAPDTDRPASDALAEAPESAPLRTNSWTSAMAWESSAGTVQPVGAAQPIVPLHADAASPLLRSPERFGLFAGLADTETPAEGLNQSGVRLSAGMRERPWCMTGFDLSQFSGEAQIQIGDLVSAERRQVLDAMARLQSLGLLPANYQFRVNTHVQTATYGFGTQFNTRPFHGAVLFGSPALGALREAAALTGSDAFTIATIAQAVPSGRKTDWVPFYGGSAGVDVPLSRSVAMRSELDLVRSHPFSDLLASGFWSYRYSCGIVLTFGGPGHGPLGVR